MGMGRQYTKGECRKCSGNSRSQLSVVPAVPGPGEMASLWAFHSVKGSVCLWFFANLGFLLTWQIGLFQRSAVLVSNRIVFFPET